MTFVDRILLMDNGNFCYYDEKLDIIVISQQFKSDPELFNHLIEHERRHREIQKRWGFWSFIPHAQHDWISRGKMMFSDYPKIKKMYNLFEFTGFSDLKLGTMRLLYGILTIPTVLFQWIALGRMFFDWIRDLF